jgi:hypothetical protein
VKYVAKLTATVDIEADNIAHARRIARRLRVIPSEAIGHERPPKNRDPLMWSVGPTFVAVTVEAVKP